MQDQADSSNRLHLNLVEHINSEICLGTIFNRESAKSWLSSTFMFVRLKANPQHYRLDDETRSNSLDDRLEQICDQAIELLINHDLGTDGTRLKATDYAHAMARYYVSFESMKVLMSLPSGAKISEIVCGRDMLLPNSLTSLAFVAVSSTRISRDQVQAE